MNEFFTNLAIKYSKQGSYYKIKSSHQAIMAAMWLPLDVEERCQIYRELGVKIGKHCFIDFGVWIEPAYPHVIAIEDYVVIAHGVKILGHDSSLNNMMDYPIEVQNTVLKRNCYIGTGAIILPGVTIGENTIVGAGSVVTRSFSDNVVIAGNPAKVIKTLDEKIQSAKNKANRNEVTFVYRDSIYRPGITDLPKDDVKFITLDLKDTQIQCKNNDFFSIVVKITNNSEKILCKFGSNNISYHLINKNNEVYLHDGYRTPLGEPLMPFESRNIEISIQAPKKVGRYNLQITMVKEGCYWYEDVVKDFDKTIDLVVI